ncbi:MAG: hypothetical protein AABY74_05230, partial [Planctomycetota bacterium]
MFVDAIIAYTPPKWGDRRNADIPTLGESPETIFFDKYYQPLIPLKAIFFKQVCCEALVDSV